MRLLKPHLTSAVSCACDSCIVAATRARLQYPTWSLSCVCPINITPSCMGAPIQGWAKLACPAPNWCLSSMLIYCLLQMFWEYFQKLYTCTRPLHRVAHVILETTYASFVGTLRLSQKNDLIYSARVHALYSAWARALIVHKQVHYKFLQYKVRALQTCAINIYSARAHALCGVYRHFCSLHAKCVRLCCDELYYAKQISWFAKSVCKIQKCMGTWLLVSKISLGVMMTTATSILMINTNVTIIMQLWHLARAGSVSNTGLGSCCKHKTWLSTIVQIW